jgi:hypothetical protein
VERAQTEPLAAQPRTNDVDIDERLKTSPGTRKGMAPAHQVRLICAYFYLATRGDKLLAVDTRRGCYGRALCNGYGNTG